MCCDPGFLHVPPSTSPRAWQALCGAGDSSEPVVCFFLFVFSGNINPRAQIRPFDCMLCLSNIIQADCELWILPQLCPVSVNSEHARAGAHVEGTAGPGLWRWGAQCRPTAGGTLRSRRPGHVSARPPAPHGPEHGRKEAAALISASRPGREAAENGHSQPGRTAAAF